MLAVLVLPIGATLTLDKLRCKVTSNPVHHPSQLKTAQQA
jgi:hypothetical protein